MLAQSDGITVLKTVIITDYQLQKFSDANAIISLNDSIKKTNQPALSSLLNYNSTIYIKENGLGMVASPALRGTTAQQTAVIWNGININSQLNGQTDFNLINSNDFSNITVRAGGGSVIYGSSAIGGSIHLNNQIVFKNNTSNLINISLGSFNATTFNINSSISKSNIYNQIIISSNQSTNDYKYIDTDLKNENAKFKNQSLSYNFGYKWRKNTFKLYSQLFESERYFSGTLVTIGKSKYNDFNTRNLIEWERPFDKLLSKTKIAFLTENYKYFEDALENNYSFGKAETVIAKYDLFYKITPKLDLNTIADYSKTNGHGSSISNAARQIFSFSVLMKHNIFEQLSYDVSFRKELTDNYKSPFLFAFGTKYKLNKNYNLKFNFSKNFRIPTFNDLYWQGAGNLNLKPETAQQTEVGQEIFTKNITFTTTGYYYKIDDMINWQPNNSGMWQPVNTKNVISYGIDSRLNIDFKYLNHNFALGLNYAYTKSINQETQLQLIYVPVHKLTHSFSYYYKKINLFYQILSNDLIYTSTDNLYFLKKYTIANTGINFDFGTKNNYKIGLNVLNVFNQNYQIVALRPMPGRNFNININFKL